MSRTLAIGLSGQLGAALLPLLDARFGEVVALSRQPQAARAHIDWQQGTLDTLAAAPPGTTRILSLGPLDAFAAWVLRVQPRPQRIVAISSTGRIDKRESPDPRERDEARRLSEAEASLFEYGRAHAIAVTLLRPTLLYGSGRDRSLSRMAAFARRWRLLPLPAAAKGRRQPVHVDDVAAAVLACLAVAASFGRGFDLPGGEVLAFDEMLRRTLAAQAPGARLLRLPTPVFRAGFALKAALGLGAGGAGWLWRLQRDQIADPSAAVEAFAWAPRRYLP
ncbi:MAG: NAD-dependent epimerase/dehydratase family protein [Arenimonas sp.]